MKLITKAEIETKVEQNCTAYEEWIKHAINKPFPSSILLKTKAGEIYIRKMARPGVLCIARISLLPEYCGQGILTKFLKELKRETRFQILQIENVHNKKLEKHLRKAGWTDSINSEPMAPTLEMPLG